MASFDVAIHICQAVNRGVTPLHAMPTRQRRSILVDYMVGRCNLKPVETSVKSAWFEPLN